MDAQRRLIAALLLAAALIPSAAAADTCKDAFLAVRDALGGFVVNVQPDRPEERVVCEQVGAAISEVVKGGALEAAQESRLRAMNERLVARAVAEAPRGLFESMAPGQVSSQGTSAQVLPFVDPKPCTQTGVSVATALEESGLRAHVNGCFNPAVAVEDTELFSRLSSMSDIGFAVPIHIARLTTEPGRAVDFVSLRARVNLAGLFSYPAAEAREAARRQGFREVEAAFRDVYKNDTEFLNSYAELMIAATDKTRCAKALVANDGPAITQHCPVAPPSPAAVTAAIHAFADATEAYREEADFVRFGGEGRVNLGDPSRPGKGDLSDVSLDVLGQGSIGLSLVSYRFFGVKVTPRVGGHLGLHAVSSSFAFDYVGFVVGAGLQAEAPIGKQKALVGMGFEYMFSSNFGMTTVPTVPIHRGQLRVGGVIPLMSGSSVGFGMTMPWDSDRGRFGAPAVVLSGDWKALGLEPG